MRTMGMNSSEDGGLGTKLGCGMAPMTNVLREVAEGTAWAKF